MTTYYVSIHLSNNFRDTCFLRTAEEFEAAALSGAYDGEPFDVALDAPTPLDACELAFLIGNGDNDSRASDEIRRYREGGRRSLSVGDLVMVSTSGFGAENMRFGCAPVGFVQF